MELHRIGWQWTELGLDPIVAILQAVQPLVLEACIHPQLGHFLGLPRILGWRGKRPSFRFLAEMCIAA